MSSSVVDEDDKLAATGKLGPPPSDSAQGGSGFNFKTFRDERFLKLRGYWLIAALVGLCAG